MTNENGFKLSDLTPEDQQKVVDLIDSQSLNAYNGGLLEGRMQGYDKGYEDAENFYNIPVGKRINKKFKNIPVDKNAV